MGNDKRCAKTGRRDFKLPLNYRTRCFRSHFSVVKVCYIHATCCAEKYVKSKLMMSSDMNVGYPITCRGS